MIEKYLRPGVRFKWNRPATNPVVQDGTIADSMRASTPLVYDGLDGNFVNPRLVRVNPRTVGFQMGRPIQYAWLDYQPGRTARLPIGPYDVLTGPMSGCILTHWLERGVRYTGHIGTVDNNAETNRVVKRTFAFAMPKSTRGFNPAGDWSPGEILAIMNARRRTGGGGMTPLLFGLITTQGDFYSVLMFSMTQGVNNWFCGGVKRAKVIHHDQLKLRLIRTG